MRVAASKLSSAPLYIEQANRLSMGQVLAIARRLKQKHGIALAVIDYIQLLTGIGDNREQEIADIAKGCKAMAMELDIPVLALSQLTDDGKLRESRAIGQIADSVFKLENIGEWQPSVQPIKLIVEKCRDGATGFVELAFLKEFTRFENATKVEQKDLP
jgi:replicative DNA helicase